MMFSVTVLESLQSSLSGKKKKNEILEGDAGMGKEELLTLCCLKKLIDKLSNWSGITREVCSKLKIENKHSGSQ